MTFSVLKLNWPATWGISFGAAVELGTVHLGCRGGLRITFGWRMSVTQKALPQGVLGKGLTSTLVDQAFHDLVLGVHGAQDSFTRCLAVRLLCTVTTVQTYHRAIKEIFTTAVQAGECEYWIWRTYKTYIDLTIIYGLTGSCGASALAQIITINFLQLRVLIFSHLCPEQFSAVFT